MGRSFTLQDVLEHQKKHGFGPVLSTPVKPKPSTITTEPILKEGPKLNKTEARFLEILKSRHPAPAVIRVMPFRFVLAHDTSYLPDFMVSEGPNLRITFYETKGAMIWAKNLIKFKTTARLFPEFRWILAQYKKETGWVETEYK